MHRGHPPKLQLPSTTTYTAGNHIGWTTQKGWLCFPQVQLLITIHSHNINLYPPAPQPTPEGKQDCLCCYNYSWKPVQEFLPLFPGMNGKSLCSALITNKNELQHGINSFFFLKIQQTTFPHKYKARRVGRFIFLHKGNWLVRNSFYQVH